MKYQVLEILKSNKNNKAKFQKLVPIFRDNSDKASELRHSVNLGFTEFRFKKVEKFLCNLFSISPLELEETSSENNSSDDRKTKDNIETHEKEDNVDTLNLNNLSVKALKSKLKDLGIEESKYKALKSKKALIALFPKQKKS